MNNIHYSKLINILYCPNYPKTKYQHLIKYNKNNKFQCIECFQKLKKKKSKVKEFWWDNVNISNIWFTFKFMPLCSVTIKYVKVVFPQRDL